MKFNEAIEYSPTLQFAEAVAQRRQSGQDILSLGLGEPDFATPEPLKEAMMRALATPTSSRYSPPLGLPSLRQKIADDLHDRCHIPCIQSDIIVTTGTKQALQLILMAILQPGDEVVYFTPAYVSYLPQIYIAEPSAKPVPLSLSHADYSFPLEALRQAVNPRTRAIILNTPHNPTGTMLDKALLGEIYLLAAKSGAYIISDEIYERLVFSATPHFSIGSLESVVDKVITVGGFGKAMGVTGWRIGYAAIPRQLMPKVNKLQQHINTNTPTLVQQAFDLAWPLPTDHLAAYNATVAQRVQLYSKFLADHPMLASSRPQGSFFAFLNIGAYGLNSIEFTSRLVQQTGIATTPGRAFSPDWDDHIRLSLAIDTPLLQEAFARFDTFLYNLNPANR